MRDNEEILDAAGANEPRLLMDGLKAKCARLGRSSTSSSVSVSERIEITDTPSLLGRCVTRAAGAVSAS